MAESGLALGSFSLILLPNWSFDYALALLEQERKENAVEIMRESLLRWPEIVRQFVEHAVLASISLQPVELPAVRSLESEGTRAVLAQPCERTHRADGVYLCATRSGDLESIEVVGISHGLYEGTGGEFRCGAVRREADAAAREL